MDIFYIFVYWSLFVFSCGILPSFIGRIARYTPSSPCKLSLAKKQKSPRHNL